MKGWKNEPTRHSLASKGIPTAFGKSKVAEFKQEMEEKPPEDLILTMNEFRKGHIEEIIKLFWWSSLNDNWKYFDFKSALDIAEKVMYEKLGEHFYLPPEEQKEYIENYYNMLGQEKTLDGRMFDFLSHYLNNHPQFARELYDEFMTEKSEEELRELFEDYCDVLDYRQEEREEISDFREKWHKMSFDYEFDELIRENPKIRDEFFEALAHANIHPDNFDKYDRNTYDNIFNTWQKVTSQRSSATKEDKIQMFDEVIDLVHHHGGVFDTYISPKYMNDVENLRIEFEHRFL